MSETLRRQTLPEFFRDVVREAKDKQHIDTSEGAECYLVGLLSRFAHIEPGWQRRPLAIDFLESFHDQDRLQRDGKMRQVGDTALFLCGIFMEHLDRQLVSADYYMTLGRSAYTNLAGASGSAKANDLFAEMADRFPDLVRVLTEISFEHLFRSNRQTVRAYTRWLHTGSKQDARWLMRRGLIPILPKRRGGLH